MFYFPSLGNGASSQFPIERERVFRTIQQVTLEGVVLSAADVMPPRTRWRFKLRGVTHAERAAIDTLFGAVEGRLRTFTFLDPMDNLLRQSEDFGGASWATDAGITISGGVSDPWNTTRAFVLANTTGIDRRMVQTLAAPGWRTYCLSVYLRSSVGVTVGLVLGPASQPGVHAVKADTQWRRVEVSGGAWGTEESIVCGLHLYAGTSVEATAFQLEPHKAATSYKRTQLKSGLHPAARFDQDVIRWRVLGPDNHETELSIISPQ